MTKREQHLRAIVEALRLLDEPALIPRERETQRLAVAEAVLDAIQDPPPKKRVKADSDGIGAQFIAHYISKLREKFPEAGTPAISKEDAGRAKLYAKAVGIEKALQTLDAYFNSENNYYALRGYELKTFLKDSHAIGLGIGSGRTPSRQNRNQARFKVERLDDL